MLLAVDRNDGAYPVPHWAKTFVILVDDGDAEWGSDKRAASSGTSVFTGERAATDRAVRGGARLASLEGLSDATERHR